MKSPILVYPDPNNFYALFMDAFKYTWSAVLAQEHTSFIEVRALKTTSYYLCKWLVPR